MTLDDFNAQLNSMEAGLMDQYKQKTLLVGARETMRFQYVSAQRAKWTALVQSIYSQSYTQTNSNGANLLSAILTAIQSNLPMSDLQGNVVTGWTRLTIASYGNNSQGQPTGFLSPIENLLNIPLNKPTAADQRPPYQIYGTPFLGDSVANYLASYFLPANSMNAVDRTKSPYVTISFAVPPSIDWCTLYFKGQSFAPYISDGYPYAAQALTGSYTQGSVQSVLAEFQALFTQIILKTQSIIQLQRTIDSAENDLKTFVSNYQQFGSTLNVAQILLDLQTAAEKAAYQPPPPPPVQPAPVSVIAPTPDPTPVVTVDPTPVVQAAAPSKLPWIAAAAAIGVMFLGGKK